MNYQTIIDELTEEKVKQILNKLNIPFDDRGNYLLMPTVCHHDNIDEASHKLYYYKNNKIFMCYSNCQTMSIFKFLKYYYETRNIVYDWYRDIYQLIVGDNKPEGIAIPKYRSLKEKFTNQNKQICLPIYNNGILDCFVKYYPVEWLNDHIEKKTMDKYNICFSLTQNKIIIPHYNINNELIGIRGRALNQEEIDTYGKYAPVWIEGKCYSHPLSMNLYGINYNWETIKQNKICYIYESEKAVMQADSFNMPNCGVAVCGSQFNKFQLNLLLKNCAPSEIVICFDNEEKPGEDKYFNKLWNICQKYKQYCNFSFIYDRKGLTNKKDSPSDKGETIFRELLSKRVRIR